MSKFRFTVADFKYLGTFTIEHPEYIEIDRSQDLADKANALLEAEEQKCEGVYFEKWSWGKIGMLSTIKQQRSTESALLWNVSPIDDSEGEK